MLAHLDGLADAEQTSLLESDRRAWALELYRLYDETADTIDDLRRNLNGTERALVVSDFDSDLRRIDDQLTILVGPPTPNDVSEADEVERTVIEPGVTRLQLSWVPGEIIAWAAGDNAEVDGRDELMTRLGEHGAGGIDWQPFRPAKLPDNRRAEAVTTPISDCLGWLVDLGATASDDSTGASVAWIGHVAAYTVALACAGRTIPQLKKIKKSAESSDESLYVVRWAPALIDADEIAAMANSLPGSVAVFDNRPDATKFTMAVISDLLDFIMHNAAKAVSVAAPPPSPTSKSEVAEAMLGSLGGQAFTAPTRLGSELSRRLDQWGRAVIAPSTFRLVVQLDPPDKSDAWHLRVLAPLDDGSLGPVEKALVSGSATRRKEAKEHLDRVERLVPELQRLGGQRQGEVILSQDEAWTLMSVTGPILQAAGFDVRVPALSKRKPAASLRITSEGAESVVGAQQLADVRWSVVFDDVELTAEEIRALARQARPLVKSRGQWVEVDRVDLNEAAAALSERADQTRLTGADMLRHALGLEGPRLPGGVSLAGEGWAADLFASAAAIPDDLPTKPEGFRGELRTYQADALGWLNFLDQAGLGGCLALDMGLGKTPTMLSHLRAVKDQGPSLVIAPPAVVGNWAAEARKFVPDLKVRVHHGPNRAEAADIPRRLPTVDVVITTYGTAVRDVDALAKIPWATVVLDEAQAIKNPSSETAVQLRKLDARRRLTLTGTPIENGLGDLWAIMDFCNPGLVGDRNSFVAQLTPDTKSSGAGEQALKALNGILVFRRTKAEPMIAAELPNRIDELDHCAMTPEQIGLYQAVLDDLVAKTADSEDRSPERKGAVLAAITALKQICNHPVNYRADDKGIEGRSGKLNRLNEIVETVFASGERMLIFTHFASWGETLAKYLTERHGQPVHCYHGGLARGARDRLVDEFQKGTGPGAMVLSLKAGGTGLNLTAANHVVLYDRWWNPAVEDQARDRVWRIGQKNTVVAHRLVCPGTVDERVEEVVAGKRKIADMVLPKSSTVGDLDAEQLRAALGLDPDALLTDDESDASLVTS